MKIGPKFKIAKRLGAPIFEKTQTQKFALSEARTSRKKQGRPGQMSDFNKQLIEKQKMRFIYGVSEKQLRKYVSSATSRSGQPMTNLVVQLESRLDNAVYRMGFAKTRRFARQLVSHGHFTVNGKRTTVPSYTIKQGDVIAVREGSKETGPFVNLSDTHEMASVPSWLKVDVKKFQATVSAEPVYDPSDTLFDTEQVLEYYSR